MNTTKTVPNKLVVTGISAATAKLVEEISKIIPGLVGAVYGAGMGQIVSELIKALFGAASKIEEDLGRLEQSIDELRFTILVTALETGRKQAERALVLPAENPPEIARKELKLANAVDRLDEAYTLAGQLDDHPAIRFSIRIVQGICELSMSGGRPSAQQAFNECAAVVDARRNELEKESLEVQRELENLRASREHAQAESKRPKETRERTIVTKIRSQQMRMITDQGFIEQKITVTVHDPEAWEREVAKIDLQVSGLERQLDAHTGTIQQYAKLAEDLRNFNVADLDSFHQRLGEFVDFPSSKGNQEG